MESSWKRSVTAFRAIGVAAILVVGLGLASPARAQEPTSKAFEKELAQGRTLMERGRWEAALKRYRGLLEDHAEKRWIYPALEEIETALRECTFRLAYGTPDARALFGAAGVGYEARTGRVKLMWESVRRAPEWTEHGDNVVRCDLDLTGNLLVEVRREGSEYLLLYWDPRTRSGYGLNGKDGVVARYDGGRAAVLACAPMLPSRRIHRVGIRRIGTRIDVLRDGREMAIVDRFGNEVKRIVDRAYRTGQVEIQGAGDFAVAIEGTLRDDCNQRVRDEHRRRSYVAWLDREWRRDAELPEWVRSGLPPADLDAIALPKGAGAVESLLKQIAGHWLAGDDEACRAFGGRLADAKVEATPATRFAEALVALAGGAPRRARELAGRVIAGDPEFGPAYAVRGIASFRLRGEAAGDLEAARRRSPADSPWPALLESDVLIYRRDLTRARDVLAAAYESGARGARLERRLAAVTAACRGGPEGWAPITLKRKGLIGRGDLTADELDRVSLMTENAFNVASHWFPSVARPGAPPRAWFFAEHEAFAQHAKAFGIDGSGRAVILLDDVRELIVWGRAPAYDLRREISTECTTWRLHETVDVAPPWFERGHALLASLDDPDGDSPLARRPERTTLRGALASLTAVDSLTTLRPRTFAEGAARYEAESLALVHLLRTTKEPELRFLLGAYYDGLREGRSAAELYVDFLAPVRESLQGAFRAHVERLVGRE